MGEAASSQFNIFLRDYFCIAGVSAQVRQLIVLNRHILNRSFLISGRNIFRGIFLFLVLIFSGNNKFEKNRLFFAY
jgi:hypothetical protein